MPRICWTAAPHDIQTDPAAGDGRGLLAGRQARPGRWFGQVPEDPRGSAPRAAVSWARIASRSKPRSVVGQGDGHTVARQRRRQLHHAARWLAGRYPRCGRLDAVVDRIPSEVGQRLPQAIEDRAVHLASHPLGPRGQPPCRRRWRCPAPPEAAPRMPRRTGACAAAAHGPRLHRWLARGCAPPRRAVAAESTRLGGQAAQVLSHPSHRVQQWRRCPGALQRQPDSVIGAGPLRRTAIGEFVQRLEGLLLRGEPLPRHHQLRAGGEQRIQLSRLHPHLVARSFGTGGGAGAGGRSSRLRDGSRLGAAARPRPLSRLASEARGDPSRLRPVSDALARFAERIGGCEQEGEVGLAESHRFRRGPGRGGPRDGGMPVRSWGRPPPAPRPSGYGPRGRVTSGVRRPPEQPPRSTDRHS